MDDSYEMTRGVGRETPDIETSSENYAGRFTGTAGAYFLRVQKEVVLGMLEAPRGKTVLEVGGGHGQLAPHLVESGSDVTVFGSSNDCHSRLLESGAITSLKYVTGDLLNLPFAGQSYDLIISVRLISHMQGWRRLIGEFCRVARHTVIIDYPSVAGLNAMTPILFGVKKSIEKNTRTYTSFTRRELEHEFRKNGFRVTAVRPQFFLPMVIHRALKGAYYLQLVEKAFAVTGLTRLFGSPVILRADRV